MAAPFSVSYPGAGNAAGSQFVDTYLRARSLASQEESAAALNQYRVLQMQEMQEAAARRAGVDESLSAIANAPTGPITLAAEQRTPGAIVTPASPGVPAETLAAMGGGPEVTLPEGSPQPEVRAPDQVTPAVTTPGIAMSDITKSLASSPRALAGLATPQAQALMKQRGVLSSADIERKKDLAAARTEALGYRDQIQEMMSGRDPDPIKLALTRKAYHEKAAMVYAESDPAQAREHRQAAEAFMTEAIGLSTNKHEHDLARDDLRAFNAAVKKFDTKGGNTPENMSAVLDAVADFQSKGLGATRTAFINHKLTNMIASIQDPAYKEFVSGVVQSMNAQTGTQDLHKAFLAQSLIDPDTMTRMIGDKGHFGDWARKALSPDRALSLSAVGVAQKRVDAEIADGSLPNVERGSAAYWKRVGQFSQEGVNERAKNTSDDATYRQQYQLFDNQAKSAERDLKSNERQQKQAEKQIADIKADKGALKSYSPEGQAKIKELAARAEALERAVPDLEKKIADAESKRDALQPPRGPVDERPGLEQQVKDNKASTAETFQKMTVAIWEAAPPEKKRAAVDAIINATPGLKGRAFPRLTTEEQTSVINRLTGR